MALFVNLLTQIAAGGSGLQTFKDQTVWEGPIDWTGQQPHIITFRDQGYVHAYSRHVDSDDGQNGKVVHYYRERATHHIQE